MEPNRQRRSAARAPRVVEASGGAIIEPRKVSIRPSEEKDLFDRYQMRQLVIRSPGGGRTELMNLDDVARDLHTRPECTILLPLYSYHSTCLIKCYLFFF